MFIATLEGIYRHGIIGISEDIKIVEKIAIESLLLEIDDYHEVDISIANLNERMNDVKFIKRYFRRGKNIYSTTNNTLSKSFYSINELLKESKKER